MRENMTADDLRLLAVNMETLDLQVAAAVAYMCMDKLRLMAKAGDVPGAAKCGAATFFPSVGEWDAPEDAYTNGHVWEKVEWAKTARGGKQYDFTRSILKPALCQSSYGLCE